MKISDFIVKLEQIFCLPLAEDFDNVGLLCGQPEREISGVLICHDALENVVDEAMHKNCNFIICFHPIIFSGLKSITGKNYVEKSILKAIENKIAIYAIHTAFDNDFYGVNYRICEELGLKNQQILLPKPNMLMQLTCFVPKKHSPQLKEALYAVGAGHIGQYDQCSFSIEGEGSFRPLAGAKPFFGTLGERESVEEDMVSMVFPTYLKGKIEQCIKQHHPYEEVAFQFISIENHNYFAGLGRVGELEEALFETEFLYFLKEKFNLKLIRHSPRINRKIKKIAVLGGSGVSAVAKAIALGCDAFVSGDFKYHDFFQAEKKILLCDIGHFESEQFVAQQLYYIISEKFCTFAILKSEIETNPINYYL